MNLPYPAPSQPAPPQSAQRNNWPRLLVNVAVALVVVAVAAATFVLSYPGVHAIALQGGVSDRLARVYPGLFDAVLVIACVAAVVLRDGRWWARCWAWLVMVIVLAAVGATDAAHAMNYALPHKQTEGVVAAAPVGVVLLAFSLLITLLRGSRTQPPGAVASRRAARRAARQQPAAVTAAVTPVPAAAAVGPGAAPRPPAPPIALPPATPTLATPTIPTPTVPSPTVPSPTVPSPTIPTPTIPTPAVSSPTIASSPTAPSPDMPVPNALAPTAPSPAAPSPDAPTADADADADVTGQPHTSDPVAEATSEADTAETTDVADTADATSEADTAEATDVADTAAAPASTAATTSAATPASAVAPAATVVKYPPIVYAPPLRAAEDEPGTGTSRSEPASQRTQAPRNDYWDADDEAQLAGQVYPPVEAADAAAEMPAHQSRSQSQSQSPNSTGDDDENNSARQPQTQEHREEAPPFATGPFAPVPRLNRVRATPTPPTDEDS